MSVKNNKSRGYAAEREIAERLKGWHAHFFMMRTGLDGGHDLTGRQVVGEVKAVRTGPTWLQKGLDQLDASPDKEKLLFVKLSQGLGHPVRWLVIMDIDQWEEYESWMD